MAQLSGSSSSLRRCHAKQSNERQLPADLRAASSNVSSTNEVAMRGAPPPVVCPQTFLGVDSFNGDQNRQAEVATTRGKLPFGRRPASSGLSTNERRGGFPPPRMGDSGKCRFRRLDRSSTETQHEFD